MTDKIILIRSELEDRIKRIDLEISSLQDQKKHLDWLINNWSSIAVSYEFLKNNTVDENIEEAAKITYSCPYCEYTCKKGRGLKQHITHFHEPKTTFKNIVREPMVICLEDGCGKDFKNNAGLMVHVAAAHRETTSLPPKPEKVVKFKTYGSPVVVQELRSKIVSCTNPVCCRLIKFVQGTGFMLEDREFCNRRCHMEWEAAGKP